MMTDTDYEPFAVALRRVFIACSGGQKEPSPDLVDLFFETFKNHPLEAILKVLKAHMLDPERGKFVPRPADLVASLQDLDGHPSPDEAWALSITAADERATMVWTMPMAIAWNVARHLFHENRVGAALAFKASYQSEVAKCRAAGQAARYVIAIGFDKAQARSAIEQAVANGLIDPARLSPEESVLLGARENSPLLSAMAPKMLA